MPDKPKPVLDPNHEPVRVIDQMTLHPTAGPRHHLTLCTLTYVPRPDGDLDEVPVVAARIRITSDMARALVTSLSQQLAMVESHGQPRN